MAEVIRIFTDPLGVGDRTCRAQVVGRPAGNIWEGWIEFECSDGELLRTPRETTQPDRDALDYWATGLSITYLEGAFARARRPAVSVAPPVAATPHFDGPAPDIVAAEPFEPPPAAVLDPFSIGAKGEVLLRQELGALRGWHLRNIIRAYKLANENADLDLLTEPELVELIVSAVEPA